MAKTSSPLYEVIHKPHDYLRKAIDDMKDYRLPYGKASIANPETGAIMTIILYFIAKEPKATRTKLECYVILLDKLVKEKTGQGLFHWRRNRKGLVSGFWRIFEHMTDKELVSKNGYSRFFILTETATIIQRLPLMLQELVPYMEHLLMSYDYYTAEEMQTLIQVC